ncbi:MAG: TetR/AcrR family transcriptional regulator [Marmoricola sp.]|nr:TetR/AcrR family transcriptional regulator [Marmoricola sp.]
MPTKSVDRASARDRLLAAAGELFYEEGVHTVGIDRVIERAGVAKASLYNAFGSKDELVKAYLASRHAATQERVTAGLATRYDTARERLLGVFEIQGETIAKPGFRGCAFVGASAESGSDSCVRAASDEFRGWLRNLFLELATEAGADEPTSLARQLCLLYDGAMVSAWMDRDPDAARQARAIAALLVDKSIKAPAQS